MLCGGGKGRKSSTSFLGKSGIYNFVSVMVRHPDDEKGTR